MAMSNFFGMELYAAAHGADGDGCDLGDIAVSDGVHRGSARDSRVSHELAAADGQIEEPSSVDDLVEGLLDGDVAPEALEAYDDVAA